MCGLLPKGSAAIFDSRLLHAGTANLVRARVRSLSLPHSPSPPPPSPFSAPPPLALSARLLLLFAAELRVRRQRSDAPDDDGLFDAWLDAQLHRATRIHVHFFTSRSRTRRSPMPETPAPFALNWYCVSVPFGICFSRVIAPAAKIREWTCRCREARKVPQYWDDFNDFSRLGQL